MQLPRTAEYALRAMVALAAHPEGTSVRAQDLAETTHIPAHYLSKVLRRLVNEGLLESRKGHGGGFSLAKAPADITFADVLRAADYALADRHCTFGRKECTPGRPCMLHPAWHKLSDAYQNWAETMTIAAVADGLPEVWS